MTVDLDGAYGKNRGNRSTFLGFGNSFKKEQRSSILWLRNLSFVCFSACLWGIIEWIEIWLCRQLILGVEWHRPSVSHIGDSSSRPLSSRPLFFASLLAARQAIIFVPLMYMAQEPSERTDYRTWSIVSTQKEKRPLVMLDILMGLAMIQPPNGQ